MKINYLLRVLVAMLSLVLTVDAATRASFCKCMCKSNSTIIPLDVGSVSSNPHSSGSSDDSPARRPKTCNDCNRQFCLSYSLPALADCKPDRNGKEEDIVTQCFQRDSAKDQAVVYTFIFLTVGLLAYAAVKPWMEQRKESLPGGRATSYMPVAPAPR